MTRLRITLTVLLLPLFFLPGSAQGQPVVDSLKCEYRVNPLGIDTPCPRLSWILQSEERAQFQTAYQVLVASSNAKLNEPEADLWNSGKVESRESINIVYAGNELASRQRVYWKIRSWDKEDRASSWSEVAWWEMALLDDEDWQAKWINDGKDFPENEIDLYRDDPAPLFRKEFALDKAIADARLYITGLGYFEASLNGKKIGDSALDPAWTVFSKRVFYSVFDVRPQLRPGGNCIAVMVGNGWYNPLPLRMWGRLNLRDFLTVGRPRLLLQLEITYADGSRMSICSDETWRVADGPILRNNIYLGETYDARMEIEDWNLFGTDEGNWRHAAPAVEPVGKLQALPLPPIRISKELKPVKIMQPSPGVQIVDMGQNFAGSVRYRLKARKGTRIRFRYGELLYEDGTLNPMTSVCGQIKGRRKNSEGAETLLGGPGSPEIAWQADTYISKGEDWEEYTPRFTFHAFRYIEITGYTGEISPDQVTGLRQNSDVTEAGSFSCSNVMFDDIQKISQWTFLSNLFAVQSDCPHRERFGYGGDIVATHEALMLNYDMAAFYAKAVQDWSDSSLEDGMLTDTAPYVGIQYCGIAWALAQPLLQLNLYRYYGDRRTLERHYTGSRRWLELVQEKYPDYIVHEGLSDHESLDRTPPEELVTPLYFYSVRVMSKLADILGRTADKDKYEGLGRKIAAAYRKRYWDANTASFAPQTQTSQAFGLYLGLVPEQNHADALRFMERLIEKEQGHLTTGILGTPFMLDVLSRSGRAETAYRIVDQRTFPGWGYMLEKGATTLWEHWEFSDNTFSHNHPMFGSVSQWFYNWLGGIQADPQAIGFDRIIIRPQVVPDLQWVECSYNSVRGRITSDWYKKDGSVFFEIQVPVNSEAALYFPVLENSKILESGRSIEDNKDIQSIRREGQAVICRVGSGRYRFEIRR